MYEVKKYDNLLGMDGFSDDLLKNHFKLYEGYVANVNKFVELFQKVETGTSEYAELKRRFGWEFNGMRLHELYFSNLKKDSILPDEKSNVYKKIVERFKSFEKWEDDFKATGQMRGIGWAVLCYDRESDELFNVWIGEHDMGHIAGAAPLLVMDVFEHAFILDYKMDKKSYIDAFMKNINWEEVELRIKK